MIERTCRIDGTQRYSWIENQRSLFVSRTRQGSLPLKTFNGCRSTAFSASSRNFDLNGEASTARTKQHGSIIPPASVIHCVINPDKVFGTHSQSIRDFPQ